MSKVKRYYGNWSDSMTEAKETDTLDQHGTMFVLATDYDALEAENRELREWWDELNKDHCSCIPPDTTANEYVTQKLDRITELKAEVAKAQSRDIVLHRWLRAKQLRINELEGALREVKEDLRAAREYQTPMGSSFATWYQEIQARLGEIVRKITELLVGGQTNE